MFVEKTAKRVILTQEESMPEPETPERRGEEAAMTNGQLLTACQQLLLDCPTDNPNRSAIEALTDHLETVPQDQRDQPAADADIEEFERLQKAFNPKSRLPWYGWVGIAAGVLAIIALVLLLAIVIVPGLSGKVASHETRITTCEQNDLILADSINNVAKRTGKLEKHDAVQDSSIAQLFRNDTTLGRQLDSILGPVNTLIAVTMPSLAKDLGIVSTRVDSIEPRLKGVQTQVNDLDSSIKVLNSGVSALNTRVGQAPVGGTPTITSGAAAAPVVAPGVPAAGTGLTVQAGSPAAVAAAPAKPPASRASGQRASSPPSPRVAALPAPPVISAETTSVTLLNERGYTVRITVAGLSNYPVGNKATVILAGLRRGQLYTAFVYKPLTRGNMLVHEFSFEPSQASGLIRL